MGRHNHAVRRGDGFDADGLRAEERGSGKRETRSEQARASALTHWKRHRPGHKGRPYNQQARK